VREIGLGASQRSPTRGGLSEDADRFHLSGTKTRRGHGGFRQDYCPRGAAQSQVRAGPGAYRTSSNESGMIGAVPP